MTNFVLFYIIKLVKALRAVICCIAFTSLMGTLYEKFVRCFYFTFYHVGSISNTIKIYSKRGFFKMDYEKLKKEIEEERILIGELYCKWVGGDKNINYDDVLKKAQNLDEKMNLLKNQKE